MCNRVSRFVNDRFNESLPEPCAAICGAKKQALHFTDAGAEFSQRDAAGDLIVFAASSKRPSGGA